ncbi:MAG TPA: nicotinate-nucleotide adenylyltransferase [Acidimicrobiia bacterium]|nr:nicotinate-nucleotide adenylyltransferase [Acidimicrobiia bacterium]
MTERVGVFGGTFDPVHNGHVVAAVETRAALDLERVLVVVAGDPWQKRDLVVASAADRLAMVEAAVTEIDGVEASALEIEREGPSVTADTLEGLTIPGRDLFLILGTDAVANMPTWRRLDETRDLATVAIVERGGVRGVDPPGDGWRVEHVRIPQLDIASTDLRDRLGSGRPVDGLVPPAAVRVIRERGLYTGSR